MKAGTGIHRRVNGLRACLAMAALAVAGLAAGPALAAPTIRFGVPTWPGVTVQSEVAAQILQQMGYETNQVNASPAFILSALDNDDLDVYLGGWMPTEKHLINPLAEKGEVEVLTTNISNAIMGLAVPKYVWDAGVHTEADLAKFGDRFNKTIYGIEPGTGFNDAILQAIDSDRNGLGDWQMIPSSTSAMLVQVERAIRRDNWIVFLGWEPHWMNIVYDIKYLKAVGDPKIAETTSDVLTVVNPKLVEKYPEAAQFLTQFQVSKDTMSAWIKSYGRDEIPPDEVASEWIASHLDVVARWLEGVQTRSGDPAIEAVRAAYAE